MPNAQEIGAAVQASCPQGVIYETTMDLFTARFAQQAASAKPSQHGLILDEWDERLS